MDSRKSGEVDRLRGKAFYKDGIMVPRLVSDEDINVNTQTDIFLFLTSSPISEICEG